MKKYAASKDKDINKLMKYTKQLIVEPKFRRYVEVLLQWLESTGDQLWTWMYNRRGETVYICIMFH